MLILETIELRALEDGASLGVMLGKIETKSQIPAAIGLYENLRKDRILKIREETFRQQVESHLIDGPSQVSRDKQLATSFDSEDGDDHW